MNLEEKKAFLQRTAELKKKLANVPAPVVTQTPESEPEIKQEEEEVIVQAKPAVTNETTDSKEEKKNLTNEGKTIVLEREKLLEELDQKSTFTLSTHSHNGFTGFVDEKITKGNDTYNYNLRELPQKHAYREFIGQEGSQFSDEWVTKNRPKWVELTKKFVEEEITEYVGLEPFSMEGGKKFKQLKFSEFSPVGNPNEDVYALSYLATSRHLDGNKGYYKTSDGRPGNYIYQEIYLPKALAEKALEKIKQDPKFIRDLVEKKLLSSGMIDKEEWDNGSSLNKSRVIRPPYESWNGKLYIQEPGTYRRQDEDPKFEIKTIDPYEVKKPVELEKEENTSPKQEIPKKEEVLTFETLEKTFNKTLGYGKFLTIVGEEKIKEITAESKTEEEFLENVKNYINGLEEEEGKDENEDLETASFTPITFDRLPRERREKKVPITKKISSIFKSDLPETEEVTVVLTKEEETTRLEVLNRFVNYYQKNIEQVFKDNPDIKKEELEALTTNPIPYLVARIPWKDDPWMEELRKIDQDLHPRLWKVLDSISQENREILRYKQLVELQAPYGGGSWFPNRISNRDHVTDYTVYGFLLRLTNPGEMKTDERQEIIKNPKARFELISPQGKVIESGLTYEDGKEELIERTEEAAKKVEKEIKK